MISLHQGQNERVLMTNLEMWRQDALSVNMDHKWTIQKHFHIQIKTTKSFIADNVLDWAVKGEK